jgi:phosphoenolpyruvate synthase/pyruvate phosphate dikinase
VLAASGLVRGVNDLEVYVMAEIPANAILVDEFAAFFDGFSLNLDAVVRGLEAVAAAEAARLRTA